MTWPRVACWRAVPLALFVVLSVANVGQIQTLVTSVLDSAPPDPRLPVFYFVLAAAFHVALCCTFLAAFRSSLVVFGDGGRVDSLRPLVTALLEAHIPLAIWAAVALLLLTNTIRLIDTPSAYFGVVSTIYWSRAAGYLATLLWFASALSSCSGLSAGRALAHSLSAAAQMAVVLFVANLVVQIDP